MRKEGRHVGQAVLAGLCTVMLMSGSASAGVTGQWDFTGGLTATIGADLQYGDGPGGTTEGNTAFGKTSDFSLPTIVPTDAGGTATGAAVNAELMRFTQSTANTQGYKMFPGAAANDGFSGGDVNQYSIVFDVYYPAASTDKYRALFQTRAANDNDADFFIGDGSVGPSPNGIGIAGQYDGTIAPDTWYRIAMVVHLVDDGGPTLMKYINGNLVGSQTLLDGRFGVWADGTGNPSWIFSDNDGEVELGYVDRVAFYDASLSANDVALLGGLKNGPVVPEPATLSLLALGAAALLRRRVRA